jgi:hypothetical protein
MMVCRQSSTKGCHSELAKESRVLILGYYSFASPRDSSASSE